MAALRTRMLDTPAAPSVSFGDDPLRMLRAARFVSQLGFTVAPRVLEAIDEMAPELARISAERVAAELDKLLLGDDPLAGIDLLVETGMGEVVLPEVGGMRLAIDEHHQHKDVYQHSLTVLRQAIALEDDGPDLVLRWAALLHDIGKPATRRHEPNGGVSFHHHEVVGAKMARKRLRALKYSKQMVDDISQLVYLHLRFHGYGEGRWTDSAVRRYVTDAGPLLPRLHKLVRADCTTRNKRRAARLQANYDRLEARIAELAAKEDLARVRPDLDGNQIMELLGIPEGPGSRRGVAVSEGTAAGTRAADHRGGDRRAAVLVAVARERVAAVKRRNTHGLRVDEVIQNVVYRGRTCTATVTVHTPTQASSHPVSSCVGLTVSKSPRRPPISAGVRYGIPLDGSALKPLGIATASGGGPRGPWSAPSPPARPPPARTR